MKLIKTKSTFDLTVYFLLCVNILLVSYVALNRNVGTYGVESDFYGMYAKDAENILDLHSYTRTRIGPGYPLTLALINLIVGDIFKSGIFLSVFAGAIFYFANYKLLSRIFDRRIAFLTFVLIIASCTSYQIKAATDLFAAAIASLCIYFFFCSQTSKLSLLFSGVLAGYAYITRYNFIYLIAVGTFSYVVVNPFEESFEKRCKKTALFALAFLCTATPWLILNYLQNGSPFYSENYSQIASTFFGEQGDLSGIGVKKMQLKFTSIMDVLRYDPLYITINYLKHVIIYVKIFCENIIRFPGYLFFGAGAFLFFNKLNRQQFVYFLFCSTCYLILCLVWFLPRFYLSLYPIGFLFVAIFFDSQMNVAASKKVYRLLLIAVFSFIACFLFWLQIKEIRYTMSQEPIELRKIVTYMNTYENYEKAVMVSRKPHLPVLLKMKYCFPLSNTMTAEEIVAFAKNNNAKYIVYSDRDAKDSPILKSFEKPEKVENLVNLIYSDIDGIHGKIILYKLRENG